MRLIRYMLFIVGAIVMLLALGGVVLYRDITRGPLPTHEGTLTYDNLNDKVEILRDARGVPHIYASTTYDLFFAQGFTQAQDRWWQMEFSRHTGSGSLGEIIGFNEEIRAIDIFIRTAGWRRAAERDLAAMPDEDRAVLEAFSDGVNAYISRQNPTDLAMEYTVLGLTGVNFDIDPWTPVDSLVWGKVMAWDLASNRSRELFISELIESDRVTDAMLSDFYPGFPFSHMPTILSTDELTLPVTETAARSRPYRSQVGAVSLAGGLQPGFDVAFGHGLSVGSNNWVVSGEYTVSGFPMIANDLHLSVGIPAIWYEVGLHCQPVSAACPYNVRGFALPATPAVIVGHNDRIGWAITNVGPDTQDLYLLRLSEDDPLQYEWDGEWREMTTYQEEIRFGDGTPAVSLTIRETHMGPIVNDNRIAEDGSLSGFNNENPMALRWTATQDPSQLITALLQLNRAENWEEFRAALTLWDSPSQNFLYADVDGNIGYQMPGRIPYRSDQHDGFTPVPGWTSDYDWQGMIPFELLPSTYNPARGYIGSVNQTVAPLSYFEQLEAELGGDVNAFFQTNVAYGYRAARLHPLLEGKAPHTVQTFREIQADAYSASAAQLVPLLAQLDYGDDQLNDYRDWLASWDYRYTADSPHAFFYAQVWVQLLQNIYPDQMPADYNLSGSERLQWVTYQLMAEPENPWWDDIGTVPVETRDQILQVSFEQALQAALASGGEQRAGWRWDQLHQVQVVHNPLGMSGNGFIEEIFNRGPAPVGGTDGALNNMRWDVAGGTFDASGSIVSMRVIMDFADFSNNRSVIPTGQSGHPFSAQYDDQFLAWTTNEDYPMYWDRRTLERTNPAVLSLVPGE